MPNWCSNRVTVYSRGENVTKDIQRIKEIFESKDTVFGKIIPQPDWKNTPNENGDLPKLHKEYAKDGSVLFSYYQFPDGSNDSRWYDWNLANWDTKWDVAGNVEIDKHGVRQNPYVTNCVIFFPTLVSNGSMMNQEWNLRGIYK